MNELESVQR